jgi:uncharacterized protein
MRRTLFIAAAAAILAHPAAAASFNCKLAKLPAEIAICSDPTLSSEDEELAHEYTPLLQSAPGDAAKTIKKEQKAWLATRNACASDMQCIMGSYRERLERFGEWRAEFAGAERAAAGNADTPANDPNAPTIAPAPAPADAVPAGDPTGDPD